MQLHHQYLMTKTDYVTRSAKQADWHRRHIASTVQQHIQNMKYKNIDKHNIRQELTKLSPLPLDKEDHQRWKKKHKATSTTCSAKPLPTTPQKSFGHG